MLFFAVHGSTEARRYSPIGQATKRDRFSTNVGLSFLQITHGFPITPPGLSLHIAKLPSEQSLFQENTQVPDFPFRPKPLQVLNCTTVEV